LSKHGLYSPSLWKSIQEQAPNTAKWVQAVAAHPSVTAIFDEAKIIQGAKNRIARLRAQA